jgi:hypothetical protein
MDPGHLLTLDLILTALVIATREGRWRGFWL